MVKVISLSNEAYSRLKALKGRDKSFSDVVVEVTDGRKKNNLMDFAGALTDNAKEWEEIGKKIYEDRKKFKTKTYRL